MSPYIAEFLGTMLLIILGDGVRGGCTAERNKIRKTSGWRTIVIAWGLAVMIAIYAVGRISSRRTSIPRSQLALFFAGDFPADKVTGYTCRLWLPAHCRLQSWFSCTTFRTGKVPTVLKKS